MLVRSDTYTRGKHKCRWPAMSLNNVSINLSKHHQSKNTLMVFGEVESHPALMSELQVSTGHMLRHLQGSPPHVINTHTVPM